MLFVEEMLQRVVVLGGGNMGGVVCPLVFNVFMHEYLRQSSVRKMEWYGRKSVILHVIWKNTIETL